MLRSLATSLAVSALLAGNLVAQVGGSLGPQTEALLRPVLDSAAQDSLPVSALQSKALEGSAKGRPPAEILAVVRGLADRLRLAAFVTGNQEGLEAVHVVSPGCRRNAP